MWDAKKSDERKDGIRKQMKEVEEKSGKEQKKNNRHDKGSEKQGKMLRDLEKINEGT